MTRLMRREESAPLRRLGLWDPELDRVFEGFFHPMRWVEEAASQDLVPAMDVVEHENEYIVKTEMPGVKKDDIQVSVENGVLTISGETKSEKKEEKEGRLIRQERRYGKYVRSLRLGSEIDAAKLKAAYKDGVLELTLPKAEEVKPKKIAVDVE
jgi:HSP20 family protein